MPRGIYKRRPRKPAKKRVKGITTGVTPPSTSITLTSRRSRRPNVVDNPKPRSDRSNKPAKRFVYWRRDPREFQPYYGEPVIGTYQEKLKQAKAWVEGTHQPMDLNPNTKRVRCVMILEIIAIVEPEKLPSKVEPFVEEV